MKALTVGELNELVVMQVNFRTLYKSGILNGLTNHNIHLDFKTFITTFPTHVYEDRGCNEYPHGVSAIAGGSLFIAIADNEDWDEYQKGLTV